MKNFTRGATAVYFDQSLHEPLVNVASTNGAYCDVYIQDSDSKIIDFYFKRQLGLTTLASNATINSYTIELAEGHGVTNGEYLSFLEDNNATQSKVINVSTNTITLDSPIDYAYTTNALVRRTTIDMNVDGSSTPVIFNIVPAFNNKWHINNINMSIEDNATMDTSLFGGLPALSKGVLIRIVDGATHNITSIKSNGEFEVRGFDVKYSDKAPSGYYGLHVTKSFNSQIGNGSAIYLDGSNSDELQIIIQDNLTGLSRLRATVQGHYVTE